MLLPSILGTPLDNPQEEYFCRLAVQSKTTRERFYQMSHPGGTESSALLLAKPHIKQRIDKLRVLALSEAETTEDAVFNADAVLGVLRRRLVYDVRDVFNPVTGEPLLPNELSDDIQWAIDGVEVLEKTLGEVTTRQIKYKLADRTATLQLAMRNMGLLIDRHSVEVEVKKRANDYTDDDLAALIATMPAPLALTATATDFGDIV